MGCPPQDVVDRVRSYLYRMRRNTRYVLKSFPAGFETRRIAPAGPMIDHAVSPNGYLLRACADISAPPFLVTAFFWKTKQCTLAPRFSSYISTLTPRPRHQDSTRLRDKNVTRGLTK